VKIARQFFLITVVVGLFLAPQIMAMSTGQSSQPWSASLSGFNCTATPGGGRTPGGFTLSATLTVTGGQAETIHFNGTAFIQLYSGNTAVGNFSTSIPTSTDSNYRYWIFNPNSINYPQSKNVSSIAVSAEQELGSSCVGEMTINVLSSNGEILATASGSFVPGSANNLWYQIVAIPLFNDSMLDTPAINQTCGCEPIIPGLGNFYNYMLGISIIVLIIGAAFAFATKELLGERDNKNGTALDIIKNVAIGLVIILVFPIIHDEVATVINYLTQTFIAYPHPWYTYGTNIQTLWNAMEFSSVTWYNFLYIGFLQLVFLIISLIVYMMVFFLGVGRIFVIGAFVVAFPLSIGLKLLPFTKKFSSMIEDTLFGLMLAAIVSGIILGVGSYMLAPGNWSQAGNIFSQAAGSDHTGQQWVAAAAITVAVLIPTIFAPLTGTLMQTMSQMAMTGVGAATMVATGGAMGGASGVSGAMSGVQQASASAQSAGTALSGTQKGWAAAKGFAIHGLPTTSWNLASGVIGGVLSGVGATQASKMIRGVMPMQVRTPSDIEQMNLAKQKRQQLRAQNYSAPKSVSIQESGKAVANSGRANSA
jgi:hypothetical protein